MIIRPAHISPSTSQSDGHRKRIRLSAVLLTVHFIFGLFFKNTYTLDGANQNQI